MTDMNRSVDLSKVVKRLAAKLADANERIAMLEVAFEDTVEQATTLHTENVELKQECATLQAKLEDQPKAVAVEPKRASK